MKFLIINGPNLNLLGSREPEIYGHQDYASLQRRIEEYAQNHGVDVDICQFNGEGEIIDSIQNVAGRYEGLIINPGAYTHYSYAIHDAIKAVCIDAIEVHLSNIAAREGFRHISVIAPACLGQISGMGIEGYVAAMHCLIARKRP